MSSISQIIRNLFFVGVLLLIPFSVQASISRVQVTSRACTNASSCAIPVNATTGGNFIVVHVVMRDDTAQTDPVSITDSVGNTYSKVWHASYGGHYAESLWYAKNIIGGATSVTINPSATNIYSTGLVAEYSGIESTNPLDVFSAASNGGAGTTYTSSNITTTQADELLIGTTFDNVGNNHNFTGTNGWSNIQTINEPSGNTVGFQEKIVSSVGTYANTGTATAFANMIGIAGFKMSTNIPIPPPVVDTTPPTISSITSSSVTTSSATISWQTNESSNTQVDYGLTTSYGSQTVLNSTPVVSHTVTLTSLSPNTTYHYRVRSTDAAGNLTTSPDNTFTTTSVVTPPPVVPPPTPTPTPSPSGSRIFYIDYASGSDSNTGTSQQSPLKRAPGMQGCVSTCASITPQPGDRFLFKGGVTWDHNAFQWNISWSGTSGNPIYFGVDPSWYTGSSWTKPIMSGDKINLASGFSLVSIISKNYITLDNIEFKGHMAYSNQGQGSITHYCSTYLVMSNLYVHDWALSSTITTDDAHGGIIGNYPSCRPTGTKITNSVISNVEARNAGRQNGIAVRDTDIEFSVIHDVQTAQLFGLVNNSEFYNVSWPALGRGVVGSNQGFDPTPYHENNTYIQHWDGIGLNYLRPGLVYNNIFHDISAGSGAIYLNGCPNTPFYVFNNVAYNIFSNSAIQIDQYTGSGSCGEYHIWNNTFQHPTSNNFAPIRQVNRSGISISTLDVRNNHFIHNASSDVWGSGAVQTISSNKSQTNTQAIAQGYTASNKYAPIFGGGTIDGGINLSGLGIFSTDINNVARGSVWDIGAYEYTTGVTTPPIVPPPIVPPPVTDTTPPTVSITTPTSGATVSGTAVVISATATDNVAVSSVSIQIDTTTPVTDTTSPYSASWNTTVFTNGTHTIKVIATDSSGNTASNQITVTVNNVVVTPPPVPPPVTPPPTVVPPPPTIVPPPVTPPTTTPLPLPPPPPPITPPVVVPPPLPPLTVIPPVGGGVLPVASQPVPPPITPFPVATASITQTLSLGSKGTDVLLLQTYLIITGYLSAGNTSGYYGTLTKQAVQKYQCQNMNICSGSESTTGYGMVGQKTRNSLAGGNPSTSSGQALTPAQRAAIQAQINQLLLLVQQLLVQLQKLKGI